MVLNVRAATVMPPCVLEAALEPGPMWTVDLSAVPQALAANDPTQAVALGGGCQLGPTFAACFDAYVTAAAAGFTPPTDRTQLFAWRLAVPPN